MEEYIKNASKQVDDDLVFPTQDYHTLSMNLKREVLQILENLYIREPGKDDYEHERLLGRNAVLKEAQERIAKS